MSIKNTINCLRIEQLSELLIKKGWRISCAESCTGGWVAKLFTDLAGSSTWFERGYVTYSNQSKHEMLGVTSRSLEKHGAVSEAVVREMAEAAALKSQTEVSIAISGIAGPGGGTDDKPVGLVWFAWSIQEQLFTYSEIFKGDRDDVRQQAVNTSIEKLMAQFESAN